MNPDDKIAVRVGAVVLVVIALGVVAMVLFGNVSLRPRVKIAVHFGHMAGLQENADVHIAGKVVGKVTALRLVPAASMKPDHPLYPTGGVTADVAIDLWYARRAAANGEYFVSSKGLLGRSYIEVGPPPGNAPMTRQIRAGDQIRGIDPPVLDRAVYRAIYNLNVSREFLRDLSPEIEALADSLDQLGVLLEEVLPESETWDTVIADFRGFSDQLGALMDGTGDLSRLDRILVRGRGLVQRGARRFEEVRGGIAAVRQELQRVSKIVPPDLKGKFELIRARLDHNLARIDSMIARGQQMVGFIERGEGTVGAIINDPEFSDDARDLGKILKRQPWRLIGHPGNRKPDYGKIPEPPDM